MTDPIEKTIEVEYDYLWALEVLACDSLGVSGRTRHNDPMGWSAAQKVAREANLRRPRDRFPEDDNR